MSSVSRALEGLPLQPERQGAALAQQALWLLRQGEREAAWLLAERLCRILRPVTADALVLRGSIHALLGDEPASMADMREALTLEPRHVTANLAMLRSIDPSERRLAARMLLRPQGDTNALRQAIAVLMAGDTAVGALDRVGETLTGWLAWPGSNPLTLVLRSENGHQLVTVQPDPQHRLATDAAAAADVDWPWPSDASKVVITRNDGRLAFEPGEFTRPPPRRAGGPLPGLAPGPNIGRDRVAIVVPVYGDLAASRACFQSLLDDEPLTCRRRIIVIEDATPDRDLALLLDDLSATGAITYVRNSHNLGFAASVNRGLSLLDEDEDVLLVNADTILPPGATDRLRRAAYAAETIGTVTPLSNNGEYTSIPQRFRENPLPSPADVARFDRIAARANAGEIIDMPNGIGFCLFVRRDALAAVGELSLAFGRGYFEDVELCLRLAEAGYRNVCAADVYVGHAGSRSFRADKRALVVSNLARLRAAWPGYTRASTVFVRTDPLKEAVAQFIAVDLATGPAFDLLISARPANAETFKMARRTLLAREGRTIAAVAHASAGEIRLGVLDGRDSGEPILELRHDAPDAQDGLAADLDLLPVRSIVAIDPERWPTQMRAAVIATGKPISVFLTTEAIAHGPAETAEHGSLALLAQAHTIGTSSRALLDRLARRIGPFADAVSYTRPQDEQAVVAAAKPRVAGSQRLIILSDGPDPAAGPMLSAIVRDWRRMPGTADVIVLGETADDLSLLASGNCVVLGAYAPADRSRLIERLQPSHIFIADRCGIIGDDGLSGLRRAGYAMACFDPAVPIATLRSGCLSLPTGANGGAVAEAILAWAAPVVGPADTVRMGMPPRREPADA
jgi:GT2 family glycosyltransferase